VGNAADLLLTWTTSLRDHVGRLEEERREDGQAERLGGHDVDHQLERHRLLDGRVGRLGPFEILST
jgi:hypothetical protein